MAKTYRPYPLDQQLLLPPDLRSWVPEGHLALFVSDVVDALDLSAITAGYEAGDGRGQPPYHPAMMVKLVVYAYCLGMPSSRRIERATYEDVAMRVLAADQHPDHDGIAAFRRRHLDALAALFVQVLRLCQHAGLVTLGHVAIDGTKLQANASQHKAMSYARMQETEQRLAREVAVLLGRAEQVDQADDAAGGRPGDLPAELQRREARLVKIRAAKAALEAEARERTQAQAASAQASLVARAARRAAGETVRGRPPIVPEVNTAGPAPTAQRNFTDPASRIMRDGATKSMLQAYNAQLAVDGAQQVIVAAEVTQAANDVQQLIPLVTQCLTNTGGRPTVLSADTGYFSAANVTDALVTAMEVYIPPDKQTHRRTRPATAAERAVTVPAHPQGCGDAGATDDTGGASPLCAAQDDCRTRLRPDQGRPWLPPGVIAGARSGAWRMAVGVHHAQPAQALPGPPAGGALRDW